MCIRDRSIYNAVKNGQCKNLYCLTTDITPYDREKLLRQIRQNLKDDEPCIVISTSLIESGVDVDFPYGYRELYGLDSILQTAGRVNRNGLRDCGNSTLFVFDGPQEEYRALRNGTSRGCNESDNKKSITRGILQKYDVDSPKAIHEYFSRLYGYKGDGLDKFDIVKMASSKLIPFQDISQKFKICLLYTSIIGDVHGNYNGLVESLQKMGWKENEDRLIFVGDLVDRGIANKKVVD